GPTLVALTQPCFELVAQSGTGQIKGFHPQSPAGKLIALHQDYFSKYDLEFVDPYLGRGGFGASTAQFLAAYSLWLHREDHHHDMEKIFDYKHLLETYNKVATHEHLASLKEFDSAELEKAFAKAKDSFENHRSDLFIDAVNTYAMNLQALGFTCEPTLQLLNAIRLLSGVKAAKGCGALGADVLFVLVAKDQASELKNFCQKNNLSIVASHQHLSAGFHVSEKEK
ncbi:MAG TPA: hypothetical protein VN132_15200, partial [Bdellovibrio sp.]|nr:hypothetical protein [Bdellovibrio sp.]